MKERLADGINVGPVKLSDAEVGGLDARCSVSFMI